jgi:Ras-related GTP-binding protein C/D
LELTNQKNQPIKMSFEEEQRFLSNPYSTDYGYTIEQDFIEPETKQELSASCPKVLLFGNKKSGKSSICSVIFNKMSPHETLFLESTSKISKVDVNYNNFLQFQIWDFPAQFEIDSSIESELIFNGLGTLVYVLDVRECTEEDYSKFVHFVVKSHKLNPKMNFEVFIHKIDGGQEDGKTEIFKEMQKQVNAELADNSIYSVSIRYHYTSIYDHSIFEAFSKIIQKLIPQLSTMENLLDNLVTSSKLEKAFLFDVSSKIYLATDSTPVETAYYELCSDMIDVLVDVSTIYGSNSETGYDMASRSTILLENGRVLYLRDVTKSLALVCIIKKESFEKIGLIKYNFMQFKKALNEVFAIKK